ncbi:MAG: SUMF1/EgtB/PvdO family nonheme iron enzyme [Candidatus Cloacimonetes bacterium]|nr:SUMF1/EgtB/PvdO family nonheme iron enzyme [Candidatus Cloacimonadota bacterium]
MKAVKLLLILVAALMLLASCDDTSTNPNQCATPVISPATGTYSTNQTVTITTVTDGATIRYTLDGTTPDSTSTVYATPFVVAVTTTVKAIAFKDGMDDSLVATETLSIDYEQCAAPVITPAAGTYMTAQTITITTTTAGATIKYTMDGTDPIATSPTYTTPFQLDHNATIKAMAIKDQMDNSAISNVAYVVYNNMISLTGGSFTMGRTTGTGYADELPTHSVTLSPFYMGKYEVTQAEWFEVMGTNPSHFTGDTNKPVEMVSFYSILVYCNKRSMLEGLDPVYTISNSTNPANWGAIPSINNTTWNAAAMNMNANGYRLPTEAEWEFAARGGSNTPDFLYSGSDNAGDVAWYNSNAGAATHAVGNKADNGLGFYDMSGNVQEWVWDWYSATYYNSSPANNPTGPATGTLHTIRGGGWDDPAGNCRVAFRNWGSPEKGDPKVKNSKLGFRVVRK